MKQFIQGSHEAFQKLQENATYACIRFRGQDLPPLCEPRKADVAFHVDGNTGAAQLMVEKGVSYTGGDTSISEWFAQGEKLFESFEQLVSWIQTNLARAFNLPESSDQETLTDMEEVTQGIRHTSSQPTYLNEDDLFLQLNKKVLGQHTALRGLSSTIVKHLARQKHSRPAVLFAVGPSGVGKTRTAEVLANTLKGVSDGNNGYQFLRLDMTEYQEPHRVSQLIGSPQGYIGHGEGSQLLNALQANPRTIILFDEIEKAHPAILKVLMNAMDAGRLSSASSNANMHEVDCRQAVFIFTSNLDAKDILTELEERSAIGRRSIEDEVCRRRLKASGLAPEIVGRIGRFLVYQSLSSEVKAEIITHAISDIAKEYGVNIGYIQPSVIIELMSHSQSQEFGVRPEKYLIDDLLGNCFAQTAEQGITDKVEVVGPPFDCIPYDHGNNSQR